jgi:hypothetical protein
VEKNGLQQKQVCHNTPHHEPAISEGGTIWDIIPMDPEEHKKYMQEVKRTNHFRGQL